MSASTYLADELQTAVEGLFAAFDQLPEDKRNWAPEGSRSAMNQLAEIAAIGQTMGGYIRAQHVPNIDFAAYQAGLEALIAAGAEATKKVILDSLPDLQDAIRNTPEEDYPKAVESPFGPMTVRRMVTYPYWNVTYHTGQIYYLCSILGCLS